MGLSWGLSWPHVGLKLIYAGGEQCGKTQCFELFSKLSAQQEEAQIGFMLGCKLAYFGAKLASCWFILGAEKCGKTQCFELFSKLWLVA